MLARMRKALDDLFWRPYAVTVLGLVALFVIGPVLVFHSLVVPIYLLAYLWPWLLGMGLNWFWMAPAMTDFLNEIGYTSPGFIDTVTPLRLSLRTASSPDAERLRAIVNRRQRTMALAFAAIVPWLCVVVLFMMLTR